MVKGHKENLPDPNAKGRYYTDDKLPRWMREGGNGGSNKSAKPRDIFSLDPSNPRFVDLCAEWVCNTGRPLPRSVTESFSDKQRQEFYDHPDRPIHKISIRFASPSIASNSRPK